MILRQEHSLKTSEALAELRSGAEELTSYIETICELIGGEEEKIHALVSGTYDFARIRSDAERLVRDFPRAKDRPPLFGLPLGVKDIFRVDGFPTRCGSKLPPSLFEGAEASCVTRLKDAGAIIIGKTITAEFATFQPGPTRNPHNLEHTPGGSSSGSAAGVSKGFFPLALGTQTGGSIIRPAAYCGVIGFKPSFGRIPTDGVIPVSASADHVGFFCRDSSGLSVVASVLIDDWRMDAKQSDLATATIGIPDGPYLRQASQNARTFLSMAADRLKEQGLLIVRCRTLANIEAINETHMRMIAAEMARVHGKWFSDFRDLYGPKTVEMIEQGQRVDDAELRELLSQRDAIRQQITHEMDEHGIDFWLTPAATDHAPEGLGSTGSPIMNLPWTCAGMPAVSIPGGLDSDGLPQGLQLVGRFGTDEQLVRLAERLSETIIGVST